MKPIPNQLAPYTQEETTPTIRANLESLEALACFLNSYSNLPYEITLPLHLLERLRAENAYVQRRRIGALTKIRALNARPKPKKKKVKAVNPNYRQKSFEEKFWLGEIGPLTSVAPNLLERTFPDETLSDTVFYTEQKWGDYFAQFIISPSLKQQSGNFIRLTARGKLIGKYGKNYCSLLKHFKESSIKFSTIEILINNFFF